MNNINDEKKQQYLLKKIRELPESAGCYLFKRLLGREKHEDILYIGKSKNLRNRVSSYFNKSIKSKKTESLVLHIDDFDFILTESEAEAYILENNLIKKYLPKYNIRLKDDRSYPYIVFDLAEKYIRPLYTRSPTRRKKRKVFGPFPLGLNISAVLRILIKFFKLRDCSVSEFKNRKSPCLLYQMNQCSAPCMEYISEERYNENISYLIDFFNGKTENIFKELEKKMFLESNEEKYEIAMDLRNNIKILENFANNSFNRDLEKKELDCIAYSVGKVGIDVSIYMMRKGGLVGHKNFNFIKGKDHEENIEMFVNFIFQYYTTISNNIPKEIIVDLKSEKIKIINEAFKIIFDEKIIFKRPNVKNKSDYQLTKEYSLKYKNEREENKNLPFVGLEKLKDLLELTEIPRVLECYDISVWEGNSPTASQIVFYNGIPDKKYYRYYHLEKRMEGNNDYAMMEEVLTRRIKNGRLPDVFIVDGGKGQINIFLKVLNKMKINIPVIGIVKRKINKKQSFKDKEIIKSEERLIILNREDEYILKDCPPLFRVIVKMRDEAHRFSRRLHHKKERDRLLKSILLEVEGIGPKTLSKIQKKIKVRISDLSKMDTIDISKYFNISEKIANRIKKRLSLFSS